MLKEIKREDIPDARTEQRVSEDAAFAESTVSEFLASGMECAEVADWPGKDFSKPRDMARASSSLRAKAKKHGAKVMQRKGRLFLQKGE